MWRKGNSPPPLVGMWVGRATMEKSMEVPEGSKPKSTIWFSSPTPRHISTKSITEQDTCTICAHISVCARRCARARAFACKDGGVGAGAGAAPRGLPEARQGSPRRRPAGRSSGFLEAKCRGARGPRGGTPGLQRESVPWPPTPRRGWGPGAQELGRGGGG